MTPTDTPLQAPPPGVAPYRKTPIFDSATVPAALLAEHSTKPGVWAVIHVLQGEVTFRQSTPAFERRLLSGDALACAPEATHSVALSEDARFQIEFWR